MILFIMCRELIYRLAICIIMCIIDSCDSLGMNGNVSLISRNTALILPMFIGFSPDPPLHLRIIVLTTENNAGLPSVCAVFR